MMETKRIEKVNRREEGWDGGRGKKREEVEQFEGRHLIMPFSGMSVTNREKV